MPSRRTGTVPPVTGTSSWATANPRARRGERMRSFVAALGEGPVAVVSHGGATADLLRTLLGDAALPSGLLAEGIPSCAITTLDGARVVAIASTEHLGPPEPSRPR